MDDLISRQAAIKQILLCENHDMEHDFEFNEGLIVAVNAVEELPTAEPRKGKWERHYSRPNVYADLFWHCSECGYKNDENYAPVYHHFCPNCGAKMMEDDMR